jgi:hypothetical protein
LHLHEQHTSSVRIPPRRAVQAAASYGWKVTKTLHGQ